MALRDNLVSWWSKDEASGNRADSHGSNTLTDVNSVGSAAGKVGTNAAAFSRATNMHFSLGSAVIGTSNITIAAWVFLDSTSEYGGFFRMGAPGFADGYGLGVGNLRYDRLADAGNGLNLLVDGIAWCEFGSFGGSGWKHVVVTRGTSTWKGYVNGTLLGTTFTFNPSSPSAITYVGRDQGYWNGEVDELAVWNRELTAAEVTTLYNSGTGLTYAQTAENFTTAWLRA